MSSKPEKEKKRENIEETNKHVPGQIRQPGQQSGQPEPEKKDDQFYKGNPRRGQG